MRMKVQFHKICNSSYQSVWDFQSIINNDIKAAKRLHLNHNKISGNFLNHVIFCEHRPVYTLGKSANEQNLLVTKDVLAEDEIEIFNINRGGDITYHGPGQLTGYLIFDLELLYRDVHRFVREIEEAVIRLLKSYSLEAFRLDGFTGVWMGEKDNLRKICAIGVHLSRWVSMHGFALNINTELDYFKKIIPCGIEEKNKSVSSMQNELGRSIDMDEVQDRLKSILSEVFNFQIVK